MSKYLPILKDFVPAVVLVTALVLSMGCNLATVEVTPTATPKPIPYIVSNVIPVTKTDQLDKNWGSLSDSCDKIVYAANNKTGNPNFRIYVIDADGTVQPLTPEGNLQYVMPDWAPGGCDKIALTALDFDKGTVNVYIMNADGSNFHPAIKNLPAGYNAYAPTLSYDPRYIVFTLSDCAPNCIPENRSANTKLGIANMDTGELTLLEAPQGYGGYKSNPSLSDNGKSIIFNIEFDGRSQIGIVQNIFSDNPTWKVVTSEGFNHYTPMWLPTRNDAFIYYGESDRADIYLNYEGDTYNLTKDFGPCKDPDVRKKAPQTFQVVATCANKDGVFDLLTFDLTLKGEPPAGYRDIN